MGSVGFKQVGDILRDVGNMNQVLWNMKQNVENMEKQLNGSGKFKNKMFNFAEKSSQTEFSVEDVKREEAEVVKENYENKPKEEKVDEEIMKAQSADIGSDIKEECLSPTTRCISRLGDELEIVKKLSLEKDDQLDKLKGQVIEQHVQIRSFERKIRMFESRGNNSIKLVEVIRKSGQRVAKIVQNEFKELEEVVAEEVGNPDIESSLSSDRNNNVEAQTALLWDRVKTSQNCSIGCGTRVGVKRNLAQDSRSYDEQGNEGTRKSTSKIRKIEI